MQKRNVGKNPAYIVRKSFRVHNMILKMGRNALTRSYLEFGVLKFLFQNKPTDVLRLFQENWGYFPDIYLTADILQ